MNILLRDIAEFIDRWTRTPSGVGVLGFVVLGSACYLLFPHLAEFRRLLAFAVVVGIYLGFLWVSGRL